MEESHRLIEAGEETFRRLKALTSEIAEERAKREDAAARSRDKSL